MNTITILFGTETGNSEMVAEDICNSLEDKGIKSEVFSMDEYMVDDLIGEKLMVLVTSTYGEGDLPNTAISFFDTLATTKPDLTGMRFAAFGLGDSSYDSYNLGVVALIAACTELGAQQVGATGRHDANSGLDPSDIAVSWIQEILPDLPL